MLRSKSGFTLVELLIVIVVIGILAAITLVAYNGVQNKANDSVVQSDLSSLVKKTQLAMVDTGGVPPTADQAGLQSIVAFTKGSYRSGNAATTVSYCRTNNSFSYYARSLSDNDYVGSSVGGVKQVTWYGNVAQQCGAGGINTSDPSYVKIDLLVGTWAGAGAGWLSWIAG